MIYNAYCDSDQDLFRISVISCGHIFAQNGRRISRPGGRNDWLLFYVAKGCETFHLDKKVPASEGSFIFFKPHEKQEHIYKGKQTAEFYYIHFQAPEDFDLFGFQSSVVYHATPSVYVRDLFEEVLNELQTKQLCYEKICVSMLLNIICQLKRNAGNLKNPHKKYLDKIAFVIQLMNREYASNKTLEDYTQICHMSKFHFLRLFKTITGQTPIEYRNKIRMDHAKVFLEDTQMTVEEIAIRVGFSSPGYFCDAFKKQTGMSPTQFRKNRNL